MPSETSFYYRHLTNLIHPPIIWMTYNRSFAFQIGKTSIFFIRWIINRFIETTNFLFFYLLNSFDKEIDFFVFRLKTQNPVKKSFFTRINPNKPCIFISHNFHCIFLRIHSKANHKSCLLDNLIWRLCYPSRKFKNHFSKV